MTQLPADMANREGMVLSPSLLSVRYLRQIAGSWVLRFRDQGASPIRLLAASLLLTAAGLKYLYLTTTPLLPDDSEWQRWAWIAQIEFEILWGLWLFVMIYSRFTRLASVLLFVIFAAFSAYAGIVGHESCGCFGEVRVKPWVAFTLDVLFAGAFLSIRATAELESERAGLRWHRLAVVLVAWLLLGVPIVLLSSGPRLATVSEDGEIAGDEHIILLDPQQWAGKRFPLLNPIDVGSTFARGHWRLLFIRPGCFYCEEALRHLLSDPPPEAGDDDARWAVVELPPLAANASATALPLHAGIPLGRLDRGKTWIANVPFTVIVVDGTVVEWAPGVLRRR